ncbi:MAG: hypothetical protein EOO42_17565 [Flavobacteriales bacterium]|nr:MAG: hypothetical protein EOO42_17565 [Flavobacteriales bacterium]
MTKRKVVGNIKLDGIENPNTGADKRIIGTPAPPKISSGDKALDDAFKRAFKSTDPPKKN